MSSKLKILICFFILVCASNTTIYAQPVCQVLDKSASKLDLTVEVFGNTKKSKVDQIKAFLWIDPEDPESADLSASLVPQLSKLFGNFEENPLMIGMLANFLDNEITFRSSSVAAMREVNNYHVSGKISTGAKNYPADFPITTKEVGKNQSKFAAKVQSKNFQQILGTPGYANGNFELLFRTKPGIKKEDCRL